MKNINLKISAVVFLIIVLMSGFNNSYSQLASICGDTTDASTHNRIPTRSPASGQFYRVLILYVAFSDDNEAGPTWNIWPNNEIQGHRPINPYTSNGRMIDTSEMSNYSDYTYSKWFQEMSRDSFDFIGDEVYVNMPLRALDYKNLGYGYSTMNNVVLHRADSLVDFSRYDNWKLVNGQWQWGTDGNVDFVIMNYRNIPYDTAWFFFNSNYGGIADIGTSATLDGKFIEPGVTALGLLNRLTRTQVIVLHEVCHYLTDHTSLGLMTPGHSQSTYHLSPHEREHVGYIQPTNVSYSSSSQTFTLRDYVKYGDCLKIQIPNSSPSEFFYIANHQKKSKYDGLVRGSNSCWEINNAEQDPYCDENKGLFVYHSSGGCSNNHGREIDIENAEGKWNWQVDDTVNVPVLGGTTPILSTITRNVDTGYEEYGKQMISGTYSPVLINDDPCSSEESDYFITWDDKGDEMDAYNVGYDEIFSPYSNPASNSCSSPTSNSGLTFSLESQDTSGAIILKIYYDVEDALHDLPPSKPKNVKVTAVFTSDTLSFYPKITWDANIEPDFIFPTYGDYLADPQYEIYKGVSSYCEDEPEYVLIASLPNTVTQFTDTSYLVRYYSQGPYTDRTFSYKVVAKDNRGNKSLKSERGLISGYLETEGGQEEGRFTIQGSDNLPTEYSIKNYPNPFNPETKIQYELPIDNFVTIKIYDILGKEIYILANEFKTAGTHNIVFNGGNLSSGIYYYKIKAGNYEQIRKMILIK